MDPEETRKLRLEVLKLAAQSQAAAGDPVKVIAHAQELWKFVDGATKSDRGAA